MSEPCEHLVELELEPIVGDACVDCLPIGGSWVHLRYCVTCKEIRCCDDSPNRHARAHSQASLHPVIRSAEPEDEWAWCYLHETGIATDR